MFCIVGSAHWEWGRPHLNGGASLGRSSNVVEKESVCLDYLCHAVPNTQKSLSFRCYAHMYIRLAQQVEDCCRCSVKIGSASSDESVVIQALITPSLDAHAGNSKLGLQRNCARGINHLVLCLGVAGHPQHEEGLDSSPKAFSVFQIEEDISTIVRWQQLGNVSVVGRVHRASGVQIDLHLGFGGNIHFVDHNTIGSLLKGLEGGMDRVSQANYAEHVE